jgi:hypothetical protein
MLVRSDVRRALEEHVLEQVREPGATRPLIRRAHVIPQVHGDERGRVVLREDDTEPIVEREGLDWDFHAK